MSHNQTQRLLHAQNKVAHQRHEEDGELLVSAKHGKKKTARSPLRNTTSVKDTLPFGVPRSPSLVPMSSFGVEEREGRGREVGGKRSEMTDSIEGRTQVEGHGNNDHDTFGRIKSGDPGVGHTHTCPYCCTTLAALGKKQIAILRGASLG